MPQILLKDPGLVPNGPDGASCMHACMQMVMRAKPGGKVFSFDEVDRILRRKPGLYSWGYAIHSAVSREGFEVKRIGMFSTERFVQQPEAYLLEYYGPEAGKVQIEKADMPVVLEDARAFLENLHIIREHRVPTQDDVRNDIRNGWYVIPLVNSKILRAQEGYSGHFVVIYGFDDEGVILHDPGSPIKKYQPQAGRKVSWELFEKAWASPKESTKSMTSFRAKEGKGQNG